MKKLRNKLKRQSGFTLVEMLIVVAIIAILIAISIPLVNKALERSRDATDEANIRSAKAEALLVYLGQSDVVDGDGKPVNTFKEGVGFKDIFYDAKNGRLTTVEPEGYGRCTGCKNTHSGWTGEDDHTGKVFTVSLDDDGKFEAKWITE